MYDIYGLDYKTWAPWETQTYVLYGDKDNLTSQETIEKFVQNHNGHLTVMKNGEHWFHTAEQVAFLNDWLEFSCNSIH